MSLQRFLSKRFLSESQRFHSHFLSNSQRFLLHSQRLLSSASSPSPAEKRRILARLKASSEPCDTVLWDMEKEGIRHNPADLRRWGTLLEKQGQIQKALSIYRFMEQKSANMVRKAKPCAGNNSDSFNFFGKNSLKRAAEIIASSVVNLDTPQGLYGSGIFYGSGGSIITCGHTVVNLHKYRVSPVYQSKKIERFLSSRSNASTPMMKNSKPCAGNNSDSSNFFGRNSIKRAVQIIAPSAVNLHRSSPSISTASGIILDTRGHILTCAHVAVCDSVRHDKEYKRSRKTMYVELINGCRYNGVVLGYNLREDIALLKIEVPRSVSLVPAKFGVATDICVGDWVVCVGSTLCWPFSCSTGVISCTTRTAKELNAKLGGNICFQHDAASGPGNSGGPVANLNGELIGMHVGGQKPGIGFSLRIDKIFQLLNKMGYGDSFSSSGGGGASVSRKRTKSSTKKW